MTKRLIILLIILAVLLIFLGVNYIFAKNMTEKSQLLENEVLFTGIISEIDLGCWVDAGCSMVIDGKRVAWGEGMVEGPAKISGKLIGFEFKDVGDKNKYIGKGAQVYGIKDNNGNISIFGSKDYFIKLVEK